MAAGSPALLVRRQFARPEKTLEARFEGALTGHVCDAQGQGGALAYDIRPLGPSQRFLGTALTVMAGPRDNLATWAALEIAQSGDVLIVATDGQEGCSAFGDILVGMAKNRGVIALVTDGLVRDRVGIETLGIPVFARGLSPNAPLKNGPGEIGMTVVVGGVRVESGDIVLGDGDGVVVVPLSRAQAVADALARVREKEEASEREVAAGRSLPSWMEVMLRQRGIRYVD